MYKALISFSGLVSMAEGEIKEISDKMIVEDLLSAGYIEEVTPEPQKQPQTKVEAKPEEKAEPKEKAEEKPKKKTTRKKKTTSKK